MTEEASHSRIMVDGPSVLLQGSRGRFLGKIFGDKKNRRNSVHSWRKEHKHHYHDKNDNDNDNDNDDDGDDDDDDYDDDDDDDDDDDNDNDNDNDNGDDNDDDNVESLPPSKSSSSMIISIMSIIIKMTIIIRIIHFFPDFQIFLRLPGIVHLRTEMCWVVGLPKVV